MPKSETADIAKAIKNLVQDDINACINLLPKTNGAINQKTKATEIEKTLGIESKKKFDSQKAYSPIELKNLLKNTNPIPQSN